MAKAFRSVERCLSVTPVNGHGAIGPLPCRLVVYIDISAAIGISKALGVDERMNEKGIDLIFGGNAEVDLLESRCPSVRPVLGLKGVHKHGRLREGHEDLEDCEEWKSQ